MKGEISSGHYEATRIKIKECIALFNTCYLLCEDKAAFLEKYNQKIKEGHFYNPFRSQKFYISDTFDRGEYQQACENIDYQGSLTLKDFDVEEKHGMKRAREEDVTLLVPRNVKKRLSEKMSPDTDDKTSKKKLMF
jgi:hypothetical protein